MSKGIRHIIRSFEDKVNPKPGCIHTTLYLSIYLSDRYGNWMWFHDLYSEFILDCEHQCYGSIPRHIISVPVGNGKPRMHFEGSTVPHQALTSERFRNLLRLYGHTRKINKATPPLHIPISDPNPKLGCAVDWPESIEMEPQQHGLFQCEDAILLIFAIHEGVQHYDRLRSLIEVTPILLHSPMQFFST